MTVCDDSAIKNKQKGRYQFASETIRGELRVWILMDIVSNAPMPSMEKMVRRRICSVAALRVCTTESVPARVEKAS